MAYAARVVVPSAAVTVSGSSAAILAGGSSIFGQIEWMSLGVFATAATGSTTIQVQWSYDGTNFAVTDPTVDGFAAITAPTNLIKRIPLLAPYYRITWTVASGSCTFSVTELALDFE